MTDTFSEGDLIEATKGEQVIRARVDANGGNPGIAVSQGFYWLATLQNEGYTLTLIEKAAPALPTAVGAYRDREGDLWVLDRNGAWGDYSSGELFEYQLTPREYAPFARLEPVADTAKKVLDRIASEVDVISSFDWKFVQLKLTAVATEFGVKFQ